MTTERKIIVTGGRMYSDWVTVQATLSALNPTTIIQGGAKGADLLAVKYAKMHNISCVTYEANWDQYGVSAGPKRNHKMVFDNPTSVVVAFPGGAGTENCIKTALEAGLLVLRVEP